jgi:rhodanese-related sulfurtransferase
MSDPRQPLVSPEWLADRLDDPRLVVLDVRIAPEGGQTAFEEGHIPGAVFTDYAKDDWRAAKGSAPGMLPGEAALSELFGGLGLRPDQHIVVVPTGQNTSDFSAAARVYWTLKAAGHRALSLLDGGWAGWRADPARPVETGPGETRTGTAYPVSIDRALHAGLGQVEKAVAERSGRSSTRAASAISRAARRARRRCGRGACPARAISTRRKPTIPPAGACVPRPSSSASMRWCRRARWSASATPARPPRRTGSSSRSSSAARTCGSTTVR